MTCNNPNWIRVTSTASFFLRNINYFKSIISSIRTLFINPGSAGAQGFLYSWLFCLEKIYISLPITVLVFCNFFFVYINWLISFSPNKVDQ